MEVYYNLADELKTIFIAKIVWLQFLIISDIYCIIILCLKDIIGHLPGALIAVLIFNILAVPCTIIDIYEIMQNNKREKDAMFPDIMYFIFAFMIPLIYYIFLGSGYEFNSFEFIIILPYTIFYGGIIIFLLGVGLAYSCACLCAPVIIALGISNKKTEILETPPGS